MATRRKAMAQGGGPVRLAAGNSAVFLPEDSLLRRRPPVPWRSRPAGFLSQFEDRALFYDCFWHADGQRILLVGPPPMNLWFDVQQAQFRAQPLDFWLSSRYFVTESVMITELSDAPRDTSEIVARIGDRDYVIPVRPSLAREFAGRNILFTMSKDNDLAWISEWARYHVGVQGADSVVLFDNGSTRYAPEDIEETLSSVPGIDRVAVLSWPYRYGAPDRGVFNNPFYPLFAQIGSMSVALRRFAPFAHGLLNCDVDELVATPRGSTIFDLLDQTPRGLIVMRGHWMEAVPAPDAPPEHRTHRNYPFVLADPKTRQSRQKKWALQPTRPWVSSLRVHPYMHWINGRPLLSKSLPPGVFYRHFKGINTNWKVNRTIPSVAEVELDADFASGFVGLPPA